MYIVVELMRMSLFYSYKDPLLAISWQLPLSDVGENVILFENQRISHMKLFILTEPRTYR